MTDITRRDLFKYRIKRRFRQVVFGLGFDVARPGTGSDRTGGDLPTRGHASFVLTRQPATRKPLDIRPDTDGGQSAFAACMDWLSRGQVILAAIAPGRCRQLWWYDLATGSPFTLTVRCLIRDGAAAAAALLQSFYDAYQPSSAAARLGLDGGNGPLHACGPLAAPMPWSMDGPAAIERKQRLASYDKNRREGNRRWSYGTLVGPASPAFARFQVDKFRQLLHSFDRRGYTRHKGFDGDIRGVLLVDDRADDPAWCVRLDCGGNHRAAVLAAQGTDAIPVRLFPENVIRRSEAGTWPLVSAGVFTRDEAESVFRRVLEADPPVAWSPPPHLVSPSGSAFHTCDAGAAGGASVPGG